MWDQTITIYNKYGNDKPARWGRKVLTGVHFKSGFGTSISETGVAGGQLECSLLVKPDSQYRSPAKYQAAEDKTGLWTIQTGDAIVPGVGSDADITGAAKASLPDCKLITGCVDHLYGSRMDHWEVTAR